MRNQVFRAGKSFAAAVALVLLPLAGSGCRDEVGGELGSTLGGGTAPTAPAEAVNSYAHDPEAFTQGLVFVVPEPYFAEGLALLDERLYQLTWQEKTAFVYDRASLKRVAAMSYAGEGWGLTTDGLLLILSDGSNVLRFLEPSTFEVVRTLPVVDGGEYVHYLNELEWVRGEIWANVWHRDQIARIDPRSGRVLAWLDLTHLAPAIRAENPEAVPNGIAFDEQTGRVFVTGKLWPVLYEIRLPAP
jgi:glutamine cyclotransferase